MQIEIENKVPAIELAKQFGEKYKAKKQKSHQVVNHDFIKTISMVLHL